MLAIRLLLLSFFLTFMAIGVIALPALQENSTTTPTIEVIDEKTSGEIALNEDPEGSTGIELDISDIAEISLNSTVSITTGTSIGSGFLVDQNTVITAYHVVDPNFTESTGPITITFEDGRTREATIEVFDIPSDLAALNFIEPIDNIPPLKFENADNIGLGDFVLAIGSPLGLDSSVSLGVISNIERNSEFQNPLQRNLLQTDASVNPGNSGGPLVNLDGRVVGIIQLRPEEQGGRAVQGVSFALRADAAEAGLAQLYEYGNIDYFRLGIVGRAANSEDLVQEGVLIQDVAPGSPAAVGGIVAGDVIISLDGEKVTEIEDIITLLWGYRDTETISIEVATQEGIEIKSLTLESIDISSFS